MVHLKSKLIVDDKRRRKINKSRSERQKIDALLTEGSIVIQMLNLGVKFKFAVDCRVIHQKGDVFREFCFRTGLFFSRLRYLLLSRSILGSEKTTKDNEKL